MSLSNRHRATANVPSLFCRAFFGIAVCQFMCGCQSPLATKLATTPVSGSAAFPQREVDSRLSSMHDRRQVATAASLMHAGDLDAARKHLVGILATHPADTSAVELLAEVSQKLGDYRLQQAALKRLIALRPDSAMVANRCGKKLLNSVRLRSAAADTSVGSDSFDQTSVDDARTLAIASLQNAVALEPRNTLFAQDLFAALIDLGKSDQAEQVLHESLLQNPQDKVLPMTAARLYESQKDWSSAVFYYDVALRNDPSNPVWRRQRAVCHFRQGSFEKAQADFSRSLANSPVKPQLSEHLAWAEAALKTEDHKEASRVLDLIVTEGEFRTADLEVLRGSCLLKQGNVEAAAEVVLQAQLEWPKHAGLWRLAKQIKEAEMGMPIIETDRSQDLASLTIQSPLR
jgi:tetratricopeptide (TPR) repeat protein